MCQDQAKSCNPVSCNGLQRLAYADLPFFLLYLFLNLITLKKKRVTYTDLFSCEWETTEFSVSK